MKFLNILIVCIWLSSGCAQYFAGFAGNIQVQNFIDQRHLKWDKFRDILTKRIPDSPSRATALELLHNVLTQLKASAFPTAISENVDPQCRNDSLNYVHSYYSLALWALKSKSNIWFWLSHIKVSSLRCSARVIWRFSRRIVRQFPASRRRFVRWMFGSWSTVRFSGQILHCLLWSEGNRSWRLRQRNNRLHVSIEQCRAGQLDNILPVGFTARWTAGSPNN